MLDRRTKLDDLVHVGVMQFVEGDKKPNWVLAEAFILGRLVIEELLEHGTQTRDR